MSLRRWVRITALLAAALLLLGLVAPALALAAAGEPVPGAEVFLAQEPGDDPIANIETGGLWKVGPNCTLEVAPASVPAGTNIVATVGQSDVGEAATDGGRVYRIVKLTPNGLTFTTPMTLSLTAPTGLHNAHMYLKDPISGNWNAVTSSNDGGKVTTQVQHFSIYGVGGDPMTPSSSTPASSPWSLVTLGLAGLVLGSLAVGRARHGATRIDA